ncbi:MAG: hypothetical protein N3E45_15610 [Oscillatoriaceae bacterium SKW80]|nr:hypothetical protein [Oscillatoriaceae bacterium SKYG93]MCX8122225.1 hypothetical protein [Oscillatoriaceae bacterium SKW80]MDW8454511.1 hypothetical protein [Oscillatoriaceae cyanobacterium SKYGB_i_bin93]HIK29372.1 hypothetical protein [Oscillatoriaceae cyanobacterium M7585_C2015_266]
MALWDQWRREREQRLQEVRQRSSQVNSQLTQLQKERQEKAENYKRELREFREKLAQAEENRARLELQRAEERKRLILNLQSETQTFLKNTRAHRQEQAKKLKRSLAEQTANLLASARSARMEMAKKQSEKLHDYYTKLKRTVAKQRQINQTKQAFLKTQLNRELEEFRKELKIETSKYLQYCKENRERQALALRSQLRQERINLFQEVWGSAIKEQQIVETSETKKVETLLPTEEKIYSQDNSEKSINIEWEEKVYNYICENKSTRLAEIESALKLKRIQAVDILRSLMQKGLIIERDRTYTAVEEITLQ